MDQDEWEDATFERAEVDKNIFQVRGIRVYDTDDAYTSANMSPFADYYYTDANYKAGSGKVGKLDYNKIDRIVVAFTQGGQAVEAVFHKDEFDVKFVDATINHVEVTLKDNLQTPKGPAVRFYAPIGGYSPDYYVLYDVVYLNGADTIGSNMPSLTNVGSTYDLVCWQIDRTGAEFTTDTVVTTNIDVYAKKVTGASDVEHIRAQNNDNLIFRKALEAYNATYGTSLTLDDITVKAVSVYGTSTETNPYYDGVIESGEGVNANRWHGNYSYYSIFNVNANIEELGDDDQRYNERVAPDDIQGINLYAEVHGEEFVCSIPRSELDVRVNNITWVDIFLREDSKPDVEPVTPDVPDAPDVVNVFGDNNVLVDCVSDEVSHNNAAYALKPGFYSEKQDVTEVGDGTYTYVITVDAQKYCEYYRNDIEHRLADGQETAIDVTFTWDDGWTCNYNSDNKLIIKVVGDPPEPSENMNGTDFEIVVFVDGTKVDDPYTYINAPERVGSDLGWSATLSNDGYIICDFEYETYDCADVKITLKDTDKYYVQGIMYSQSYGENGAKSVTDENNGVYIIDNISDGTADHASIFIDTKYSVEYHLDDSRYEDYNNDTIYVLNRRIGSTTDGVSSPSDIKASVQWRNPKCDGYISVKFELPVLPNVEGKDVSGWYAYNTGEALSGEIRLDSVLPDDGSTTIKFYANTKEVPETTKYPAGFFVLMPEKMTEDFQPGDVYPTDSYYPNADGDSVTTASNPEGRVDDTTGYIGYLTEAGYEYFIAQAGGSYPADAGSVRVSIPTEKADEYLIIPEEEDLGTVWDEYLINGQYELVCYQINNSTLGVNWPSITSKAGSNYETYDGQTFHVDCYIQGVAIAVTYDANYDGGTIYKHDKVNGEVIRTGDRYTVLGNTEVEFSREGYTFKGWSTSKDGDVIYTAGQTIDPIMTDTILYAVWEEDESQTKELRYTVEYYKDGVLVTEDTEIVTKTVWINDTTTTLEVKKEDIDTADKYPGFAFDYSNPATIPDSIETGNVIKVYYATDSNNDDIPDKYQVFVNFESANVEQGTVANDESADANNDATKVYTLMNGDDYAITGTINIVNEGFTVTPVEGYAFDIWTETQEGTTGVNPFGERAVDGGTTITFYAHFAEDNIGEDDPNEGDGIPDKYQATVTYKVENGTWFDESSDPIEEVFTLKTKDVETDTWVDASPAPTLGETIPTGMIPGENYTNDGAWDVDITSTTQVTGYVTYTYTFSTVKDYTVTIAPANIIAYTGGTSYSVIVNGSGAEIGTTTSGLPVPGYHIELSRDVQEWLGTATGQQLDDVITFTYNHDGETRTWNLSYVGVYSTDAQGQPETYVYELESTGDSPEVRLQFTDENGDVFYSNDDIPMTEQTVNAKYSMTIYGGLLDQNYVEAQIKRPDGETITADVIIGTGTLTVLSTTNEEYTTDLNEDSSSRITADVNDGTTFTVNDSEVTLEPEDVKLLVDSVSNNDDFNAALEDDARDHVSMYNAGTESFYLDLVHADNGNVQVGLDGSLTISWPMPDDADPDGEFTIVHYVDMDRSAVMGEDNLANADKEEISVIPIGDQLIFNVESFSPFVLVYETDDGYDPIIPTPDDDTEYVPKWLNTEDHFAYIVGYEDGEVKPNNNITRAEVATIFFRLLTDDARARYWSQTNDYTDVAADSWYNNAISTLSNMGIINGYEDGTFQPNASITRAEFTAIATRFFDYTAEYDGAFNDVSRSAWYADCVQAAVDMGLVDGYPDGGFHPNSNITRAEAVTIVNRVLNRAPHEDHLLDEDEMNVWPDNVYGAWYYADMQEATNSHDYDWIRVSGERVEEWTEKLPERDWAALEQEWSSAYSG